MLNTKLLNKLLNKQGDNKAQEYVEDVMFFFLEKGIDENQFNELSLPYIFAMLRAANRQHKREKKELEKSKRKTKR
jgi:hypothetical protein